MNDTAWLGVCAVDDIPSYGSRRLVVGAMRVALIRTEGASVYALEDRCPHRGGPLSEGIVAIDRVACPLHGQCVELATGTMVAPDEGQVRRFEVRIADEQVWLRRDELRAETTVESSDAAACG
jgi:nitrite reductase (NADH) small subunit